MRVSHRTVSIRCVCATISKLCLVQPSLLERTSFDPPCFPEISRDAATTMMITPKWHPWFLRRIYGPNMPLDIEKYRHFVSGYDLSKEEQTELIQNVWTILESLVDQSFGRHPHQQCGRCLEHNDLQGPVESLESKESQPLEKTQPIGYEALKNIGPP